MTTHIHVHRGSTVPKITRFGRHTPQQSHKRRYRIKSILRDEKGEVEAKQELLALCTTRNENNMDGDTRNAIENCVSQLEKAGGIDDPCCSPSINGRWQLLLTSKTDTSSPIQRTFTNIEQFRIYQDVLLDENVPQVNNVVVFGGLGQLKVEALAVTDALPKEGFTPRQGQGLPFLGKSSNSKPKNSNQRIDFQFTKAAFDFKFLPFPIPYPVPFQLLQDESKGWLDTTYLSETLRISRGNKGTLFILAKMASDGQDTLQEENEEDYEEYIKEKTQEGSKMDIETKLKLLDGEWKLKWTSQGSNASALQKFATSFDNYQVVNLSKGTLENVALFLPGLVLRAQATCETTKNSDQVDVNITGAKLKCGPVDLSLPINGKGFIQVLYVDEHTRITKGSKDSLFIHTRSNDL